MSGYSNTPLIKKLGIKDGFKIKLINQPENYFELVSDLISAELVNDDHTLVDFVHLFSMNFKDFSEQLAKLKNQIQKEGMIWVSWPKKASKIQTDINENIIRETAISNGLVDVKVCAIDETWSGLKLIYKLKDRN